VDSYRIVYRLGRTRPRFSRSFTALARFGRGRRPEERLTNRPHLHAYYQDDVGISVVSRVMWENQGRSFRYSAIHSEAVPPDQSLPWMKGRPPHSTFSIGALR